MKDLWEDSLLILEAVWPTDGLFMRNIYFTLLLLSNAIRRLTTTCSQKSHNFRCMNLCLHWGPAHALSIRLSSVFQCLMNIYSCRSVTRTKLPFHPWNSTFTPTQALWFQCRLSSACLNQCCLSGVASFLLLFLCSPGRQVHVSPHRPSTFITLSCSCCLS